MMDELNKIMLEVPYTGIENNPAKRVSGSEVWDDLRSLRPPLIPARLRSLTSLGLLEKDEGNSSSRTEVYAPTDAGYSIWQQTKSQTLETG